MKRLSCRGLRVTALAAAVATAALILPAATLSVSAAANWTVVPASSTPIDWSTVSFLNGQWIALSPTGQVGVSSDGAT
jgi:hypothetical protein